MEEDIEKTPFELIVETLLTHGVEFIVVGGQAETLHGSSRVTFDTDVCYRRTNENLQRLADALAKLHPRLRDAPADLPFRLDAKSLELGANFTLATDAGPLDLLGLLEPIGGFDEAAVHAERMDVGVGEVLVLSLDDLIRIKEHIQRPKDREALFHLVALRRLRDG